MKNSICLTAFLALNLISCSKRKSAAATEVNELKLQYDTTAIDSFSPGAFSVDVAREIRMSSQKYQDSLKEALRIEKETKKIEEALLKEKKAEDDKKKKTAET
jgi:hypothetical protein